MMENDYYAKILRSFVDFLVADNNKQERDLSKDPIYVKICESGMDKEDAACEFKRSIQINKELCY